MWQWKVSHNFSWFRQGTKVWVFLRQIFKKFNFINKDLPLEEDVTGNVWWQKIHVLLTHDSECLIIFRKFIWELNLNLSLFHPFLKLQISSARDGFHYIGGFDKINLKVNSFAPKKRSPMQSPEKSLNKDSSCFFQKGKDTLILNFLMTSSATILDWSVLYPIISKNNH